MNTCCESADRPQPRRDYLFWGSLTVIAGGIAAYPILNALSIAAPLADMFGNGVRRRPLAAPAPPCRDNVGMEGQIGAGREESNTA